MNTFLIFGNKKKLGYSLPLSDFLPQFRETFQEQEMALVMGLTLRLASCL